MRGTYDILRYTIEEINQNKASLFEANKRAENETIERGKTYDAARKFPLRLEITENSKPFAFKGTEYTKEKSDISGVEMIKYGTKPFKHHDSEIRRSEDHRICRAAALLHRSGAMAKRHRNRQSARHKISDDYQTFDNRSRKLSFDRAEIFDRFV